MKKEKLKGEIVSLEEALPILYSGLKNRQQASVRAMGVLLTDLLNYDLSKMIDNELYIKSLNNILKTAEIINQLGTSYSMINDIVTNSEKYYICKEEQKNEVDGLEEILDLYTVYTYKESEDGKNFYI